MTDNYDHTQLPTIEACTKTKDIELAQKIIDQEGSCRGIYCKTCPIKKGCDALIDDNPAASEIHYCDPNPAHVELAESFLLENKYKEA